MVENEKTIKSEVSAKEEKILEFWQKKEIFKKTLEKDAPKGNFVFFDGPPFATGLPHYGHVLPGTIKDVIPRYQTMLGKKVLRRWGWDCHGLPVENLVEKELSLASKKEIEVYGVEKFNKYAGDIVFRYAEEWKKIIPRVSRWVDMENDYRTMDSSYTESVWWSFKTLYDKGLIYQGFKSMLICPRCETTLSNFEVNQGYKDITDISVAVKFKVEDEQYAGLEKLPQNTYILAWTTTPWTLPGNVALAVSNDIEYVLIHKNEEHYILARDLVKKFFPDFNERDLSSWTELAIDKNPLVGLRYKPLFDYYNNDKLENRENAWKVYAGSFVTSEDGTGIVHMAPAFGEDDMVLGKENNLPFIQHVNKDGTFKDEVSDFAGLKVKPKEDHQQTDVEIIKYLAHKGLLFSKEKIVHSYPHCWRCSTPLLNYATTSWFIKVTALKERLVELNKTVAWIPEDIRDGRFGKWLEGARDWAISRSRYWGAPIPVWEKENGEKVVLGSISDLKNKIGRRNNYFLMRHGGSVGNLTGTISSKKENQDPLTSEGRREAFDSAEELVKEKIDIIISSPFVRTKETAEIVAEKIGIPKEKIVFDDRFSEVFAGEYEGKFWKDFDFRNKVDGAESLNDVRTRVMKAMYDLDKKYEGKNILIVSHGGPLGITDLGSKGFSQKEIIKHYFDNLFTNAEIRRCDFVPLPHNETYEIDLHRPYIDNVVLYDKDGSLLRRVPEVFDCWYESGAMSFAEHHYPFENKEEFEKPNSSIFPADFIAEGLDQTRGWFYTLFVLSAGLFDRAPYKHVVVNGLVLAEDGRKMSKSLNNYPDPMSIVDKYGADALRYYLMSSPLVKAEDFNFSEKGVDEIYKKLIQKTYNVLSFYEMYPVEKMGEPKKTILDTWIMARLNELTLNITNSLNKYELDKASRPILDFVDDLSTWYLRRSRDRFKSGDDNVKYSASYYTKLILNRFSIVIAPFLPFMSEEIYSRTGGDKESVHLEDWPKTEEVNNKIIEDMKKVREVVTSALELRQKAGIKVRQPLQSLTIPDIFSGTSYALDLISIVDDEVNVKEVKVGGDQIKLDTVLTPELKNEGFVRDVIRAVQDARKKENLSPSDKINLVFNSDKESVLNSHLEMIKFPTQTINVSYSKEKQNYVVDTENSQSTSFSVIK